MADHAEVHYADATGNDYPAHLRQYDTFIHIAFIGACHVINVVLALTIGTVIGDVITMCVILVVATLVAAHGLAAGVRIPSAVMVLISVLVLAFCAFVGPA